jgi:NAD(P)H-nitrite reductase large subunit
MERVLASAAVLAGWSMPSSSRMGVPMSERRWDVVIVGGGIAGHTAAAAIVERDRSQRIMIITDEDRIPYRRTKISKRLAEGFSTDELALQSADWYRQHDMEVRIDSRVVSIDPKNRSLTLEHGNSLYWNCLILATGAAAVVPDLPGFREGMHQGRIFTLRTALEAERLRAAAAGRKSALVVGAGVLGIEVAEQLQKTGLQVTVVEKRNRVMAADLDDEASNLLEELLRSRGIQLYLGRHVRSLMVDKPGPISIELDGEKMRVHLVVFCLGSVPRNDLAMAAGLTSGTGIRVDRFLRTSHPSIFAAGDAAVHSDRSCTHLWYAAESQGKIAGSNVCGEALQFPNAPFRLKMEVFGHYFFSMKWSGNQHERPVQGLRRSSGSAYQSFSFLDGKVWGAVMIDDKPRAELYKQAVSNRYRQDRVARDLSL